MSTAGRGSGFRAPGNGLAGRRPVAVAAGVEDGARESGDAHRERGVARGHAAPAGSDHGAGGLVDHGETVCCGLEAKLSEALRELWWLEKSTVRAEISVDRSVQRRRDVPGRRINGLDLTTISGARARIEEDDLAELGGQAGPIDDPAPARPQVEPRSRRVVALRYEVPSVRQPCLDAPVEDGHAPRAAGSEAQIVEHPPKSRGHPAADVVIGHHEVIVSDTVATHRGGECRWVRQGMPTRSLGGHEFGVEIHVDRARDVPFLERGTTGAPRLAEVPANVHHAKIGATRPDPGGEFGNRDQRTINDRFKPRKSSKFKLRNCK